MGDSVGYVWVAEPPEPHFTDRDEYLAQIRQAAESERDAPATILMSGRSGMGKSALLSYSAAKLRDLMTDCLYVDFQPLSHEGGVKLSDALAGVLLDLGIEKHQIPEDVLGRRRLYLRVTEGKRLLVLLDNVGGNVACISSFRPNSPHALVLATSERTFDVMYEQGFTVLPVRGLDLVNGAKMMTKVCGRDLGEPEQVGRLVEFYGGVPQWLRIAAGRLRARPELTAVEVMGTASGGTDRMHEGLQQTYDGLRPLTKRLYWACGVLPGAVQPVRILTAALGVTEREVRGCLAELSELALVDRYGDDYRLSGAIRSHATAIGERVDIDDVQALLRRGVTAWLEDAVEADSAVQQNRLRVGELPANRAPRELSKQDALRWFGQWQESLVAVMRLAPELGLDDAVWQVFQAMWPFYSNTVFFESWQEAGKLAVAAAVRKRDEPAEARVRCLLARAFIEQNEFEEADAQLKRARAATERAEDRRLYASVLDFAGKSLFQQGKFAKALVVYRESLELHEQLEDSRGTALQSQFVGRCLGELGRGEDALAAFDRAQHLIAEQPEEDLRTKSRIAFSRGKVLKAFGNRDVEAVSSLREALQLADELGSSALVDEPVRLLIELAERAGDVGAERRYLQRAHELHARTRSPYAEELRQRLAALPPDDPEDG